MRRQLASFCFFCLIIAIFCLPEFVILPNLGAGDLRWPYLLSMIAAAVVIHLVGRQANRREIHLQMLGLRLEHWSFILVGVSLIVYLLATVLDA